MRITLTFKFLLHSEQAPHSLEIAHSAKLIFPIYFAKITWLCKTYSENPKIIKKVIEKYNKLAVKLYNELH